ncbi:MAG: hypothetical protein WCJ07_15370 [Verrucomicrobiota bacterium]
MASWTALAERSADGAGALATLPALLLGTVGVPATLYTINLFGKYRLPPAASLWAATFHRQ